MREALSGTQFPLLPNLLNLACNMRCAATQVIAVYPAEVVLDSAHIPGTESAKHAGLVATSPTAEAGNL
jgi:hypothetical protein